MRLTSAPDAEEQFIAGGDRLTDFTESLKSKRAVVESLDDIAGSVGTRNQIKENWDEGCRLIYEGGTKGKDVVKLEFAIGHEQLLYSLGVSFACTQEIRSLSGV